mmetsp:Transcript_51539/g.120898  ORF Transcript_51539/g.120898 Transcript_51539/m.120898 type:complete len:280 (-) Transcript_51539:1607-2446(-)
MSSTGPSKPPGSSRMTSSPVRSRRTRSPLCTQTNGDPVAPAWTRTSPWSRPFSRMPFTSSTHTSSWSIFLRVWGEEGTRRLSPPSARISRVEEPRRGKDHENERENDSEAKMRLGLLEGSRGEEEMSTGARHKALKFLRQSALSSTGAPRYSCSSSASSERKLSRNMLQSPADFFSSPSPDSARSIPNASMQPRSSFDRSRSVANPPAPASSSSSALRFSEDDPRRSFARSSPATAATAVCGPICGTCCSGFMSCMRWRADETRLVSKTGYQVISSASS